MLLQLEQECLDIYRRKVEKTKKYRADLRQTLNEAEIEVSNLASTLDEQPNFVQVESFLHCCHCRLLLLLLVVVLME